MVCSNCRTSPKFSCVIECTTPDDIESYQQKMEYCYCCGESLYKEDKKIMCVDGCERVHLTFDPSKECTIPLPTSSGKLIVNVYTCCNVRLEIGIKFCVICGFNVKPGNKFIACTKCKTKDGFKFRFPLNYTTREIEDEVQGSMNYCYCCSKELYKDDNIVVCVDGCESLCYFFNKKESKEKMTQKTADKQVSSHKPPTKASTKASTKTSTKSQTNLPLAAPTAESSTLKTKGPSNKPPLSQNKVSSKTAAAEVSQPKTQSSSDSIVNQRKAFFESESDSKSKSPLFDSKSPNPDKTSIAQTAAEPVHHPLMSVESKQNEQGKFMHIYLFDF